MNAADQYSLLTMRHGDVLGQLQASKGIASSAWACAAIVLAVSRRDTQLSSLCCNKVRSHTLFDKQARCGEDHGSLKQASLYAYAGCQSLSATATSC